MKQAVNKMLIQVHASVPAPPPFTLFYRHIPEAFCHLSLSALEVSISLLRNTVS